MRLNGLVVDVIRLIAYYLDDTALVQLYGTFNLRLQRLLYSSNAVPRLTITENRSYDLSLLKAFAIGLASVREIVVENDAALPKAAIALLPMLKPTHLTLGPNAFANTGTYMMAIGDGNKLSACFHSDTKFPLLHLLTPTLEALDVQCELYKVAGAPSPSFAIDLSEYLPNTLTSLKLELCVTQTTTTLLKSLPPTLTLLELLEKTEYSANSISLSTIFARCPNLRRLSIDGVATVWKAEDEASPPNMLPQCLESLAIGAWSFPIGFLRHPSFKSSSLVEFELLGVPGAVFNPDNSLEDCRIITLEPDQIDIDLHALSPPSLRTLRMRYDALGSSTASRFTSLPLSITEFSFIGTALSPDSLELFRPLRRLQTLSFAPDTSIARTWPVTRPTWNFEFVVNLAINDKFDITTIPPSLTSLHVVAELPQIFGLVQHLPLARITCPIPPIWKGAMEWLANNCPELGSTVDLDFVNLAELVKKKTLGRVTFTRPWDSYQEDVKSEIFSTRSRLLRTFFKSADPSPWATTQQIVLKTILPEKTRSSSEQEDLNNVERLAENLFRFSFAGVNEAFPKVTNIAVSIPQVNIYDLFSQIPSRLTSLDLQHSELPDCACRDILPPTLTKLSSMKPMTWTFLLEEWEAAFHLNHIDTPFWNIRATPYWLRGLSENFGLLRAKISNVDDYNIAPFLTGFTPLSRSNLHLELAYVVTGSLIFERAKSEGRILTEVTNDVMRDETTKFIFHELSDCFKDEIASGATKLSISGSKITISFGGAYTTIEPEAMATTACNMRRTHDGTLFETVSPWISLPSQSDTVKHLRLEGTPKGVTWTVAPDVFEKFQQPLLLPSRRKETGRQRFLDSPGRVPISLLAKSPVISSNEDLNQVFFEYYAVNFPCFLDNWSALASIELKDIHPSVWPLKWPSSVTSIRVSTPYRIGYIGAALPENLSSLHLTCGDQLLHPSDGPRTIDLRMNLCKLPKTLTSLHLESTPKSFMHMHLPESKPKHKFRSLSCLRLAYPTSDFLKLVPKLLAVKSSTIIFEVVGFGTREEDFKQVEDTPATVRIWLKKIAKKVPTMKFVTEFTA